MYDNDNDHTTDTKDPAANEPRPRAAISQADPLHEQAHAATAALARGNDPAEPAVMVRGNALVRMTERGVLEDYNVVQLADQLSRVAAFRKLDGNGWATKPPTDVAKTVLHRDSGEYADLPRVDRVVDVPVLGPDGQLVTEPGHHPASRLFYRPAPGLEDAAPPEDLTTQDVEEALDLLLGRDGLLGAFEFAEDGGASRANALGLLLLPFVREYVGVGSVPLHAVLAPDIGSGKTLLAQAALLPGCGRVAAQPGTDSEEEWRKSITAGLLQGDPAVLLDNLSGKLDTGSLAAALTAATWKDRILGESRTVVLPIRNAWAVTGNNLALSREMARRTVACYLEPGEPRPADRDRSAFPHPDLLGWAERNRRDLVRAALTLVRHWADGPVGAVEGGYLFLRTGDGPRDSEKTKGSFERWAGVVGGVLEAAGVEGFLGNEARLAADADEETREEAEFLAAWRAHTLEPLRLRELLNLCQIGGELRDALPTELAAAAGNNERFHGKLSAWLTQRSRRRIGDYQLVAQELGGKGNRRGWVVLDRGSG